MYSDLLNHHPFFGIMSIITTAKKPFPYGPSPPVQLKEVVHRW